MSSVPVARRLDGDGWVRCTSGHQHWGRHGAAGLLLSAVDGEGQVRVLLQKRAWWTHHGDTWGLPGGARASWETAVETALRETSEEVAVALEGVRVERVHVDDHGGWSYSSVLATADRPLTAGPLSRETADVCWVRADEVTGLDLHPGFAATWPALAGPQPR